MAVVLTREPYQGEDATELVSVDYEPLPAVIGFEAALAGDTLLFAAAGTNVAGTFGERDSCRPTCSTAARPWSRRRSSTSGWRPRRWRAAARPRSGARTGG